MDSQPRMERGRTAALIGGLVIGLILGIVIGAVLQLYFPGMMGWLLTP